MGYPISWAPLHVPTRGRKVTVIAPYTCNLPSDPNQSFYSNSLSWKKKKRKPYDGVGRLIRRVDC